MPTRKQVNFCVDFWVNKLELNQIPQSNIEAFKRAFHRILTAGDDDACHHFVSPSPPAIYGARKHFGLARALQEAKIRLRGGWVDIVFNESTIDIFENKKWERIEP